MEHIIISPSSVCSNSMITYQSKSNPNVQVTLEFSGTAEKDVLEKEFASVLYERVRSEFTQCRHLQNKFEGSRGGTHG